MFPRLCHFRIVLSGIAASPPLGRIVNDDLSSPPFPHMVDLKNQAAASRNITLIFISSHVA